MKKYVYITLGLIFFVLGSIGIFIPILPTFPFYLFAFILFSNSSQKLKNYIISTKFYKENLKLYIEEKKMTKLTKIKLFVSLGVIVSIGLAFMLYKKLYIPSVILFLVYLFHVIYFGFFVKTIK